MLSVLLSVSSVEPVFSVVLVSVSLVLPVLSVLSPAVLLPGSVVSSVVPFCNVSAGGSVFTVSPAFASLPGSVVFCPLPVVFVIV